MRRAKRQLLDVDKVARALTPTDLAARLSIGIAKVLGWIKAGELKAINVASDKTKRPQWSILPQFLAEFEAARMAKRPRAKYRPRRPRVHVPANGPHFDKDGRFIG